MRRQFQMPILGQDLQAMRSRRGLTQSDLAHHADVAASVITVAESKSSNTKQGWRYSTAIKVYNALSNILPLSPEERAQFTRGTGIAFLDGKPAGPAEDEAWVRSLQRFSELLRYLREERKMTQEKLATAAGVALTAISDAENSSRVTWSKETSWAVLKALSSRFRLLDAEETAYRSLTGLPAPEASTTPQGTPSPSAWLSGLSQSQLIEVRPLINALERLYNRFGMRLTLLSLEHLELMLVAAVHHGAAVQIRQGDLDDRTAVSPTANPGGPPLKPNLAELNAVRHTVNSDAGVVDVYTPKPAAATATTSKKSNRRTG